MEITLGNLTSVFRGLRATFLNAVKMAKENPPETEQYIERVPSTKRDEDYPTANLLGDLERLLDEYADTNLMDFVQNVPNIRFGRIINIPRDHIEDDSIGMYRPTAARLGTLAQTHAARRVPYLFVSSDGTATGGAGGGFQTNWIDAQNVFSNTHVWPNGVGWDNLDALPLTQANYRTVVTNLEQRVDPDGRPMGLHATDLLVGPQLKNRAKEIITRQLIGGGNSNIHLNEVTVRMWNEITDQSWFVIDNSPEQSKCVLVQERSPAAFTAQESPTDDDAFERERYRYRGSVRYGSAIIAPWLIQAVDWNHADTTTTPS